jgi:peptide deformylase
MKDVIVQDGDPVLRAQATPVLPKDIGGKKLTALIAKMKKTLAGEEFGVALAAPQVGAPLRLFVVSGKVFEKDEEPGEMDGGAPQEPSLRRDIPRSSAKAPAAPPVADRVFINPKITRLSKKTKEMSEGCLSVRGTYGTVMRHEKASLTALDERGRPVAVNAAGLLAHIFQHECDHLDGTLYIDKAVHLESDEDMKSARQKLKDTHGI